MKSFKILYLFLLAPFFLWTSCCGDEPEPDCINPEKIDPTAACIEIYQPVCGCDGKTYDNSCFAEIAGVVRWTEGTCEK